MKPSNEESYQDKLRRLGDEYAHSVYKFTRTLPKDEVFGVTSQIKRASLSVPLNIIEGFSRNSEKSYKYFLSIALGSLKESEYLLTFCKDKNLLGIQEIQPPLNISHELGKMLWGAI